MVVAARAIAAHVKLFRRAQPEPLRRALSRRLYIRNLAVDHAHRQRQRPQSALCAVVTDGAAAAPVQGAAADGRLRHARRGVQACSALEADCKHAQRLTQRSWTRVVKRHERFCE
eukprot:526851-Prymnesium_polylepis.2